MSVTPSFAEATAAARRIQDAHRGREYTVGPKRDADLLAAFVLAGDTERLRTALERIALGIEGRRADWREEEYCGPANLPLTDWQLARAALAGGGRVTGPHLTQKEKT